MTSGRGAAGSGQVVEDTDEAPWPIYRTDAVVEFLELLLPSAESWAGAGRGDLVYRGQSMMSWGLVPRAFRKREIQEGKGEAGTRRVGLQAQAEFRVAHEFVKEADSAGLRIPERGGQLLLQEDPSLVFGAGWEHAWPQEEVWEALALAQHHKVVTRLLDFTESGLVAAFWAAFDAWDRKEQGTDEGADEDIAVWVVDQRFFRAINGVRRQFPERVAVVRVPRGSNAFLHAQLGVFLVDRGANDVLAIDEELALEHVVVKRARYWCQGDRLEKAGLSQTWFGDIPIAQVCLPRELALDLLRELRTRNITIGNLMPSLDRVVEALNTDSKIATADWAGREQPSEDQVLLAFLTGAVE